MSTTVDSQPGSATNRDPVCGMTVKPDAPSHHEYNGKTYRFCSPKCQTRFSANPGKYLIGGMTDTGEIKDPVCGMTLEPEDALHKPDVTEYVCPMHAQIVRMVSEAQRSRAPIQKVADTVSGYFVPIVVLIALLAFAVWMIWGPEPRFAHAIVAAAMSFSSVSVIANALRLNRVKL